MERVNAEGLTESEEAAIFWQCRAEDLAREMRLLGKLAKALPVQSCGEVIEDQVTKNLEMYGEFVAEFKGRDVSGYSDLA